MNISDWVSEETPEDFPPEHKPFLFSMCVALMRAIQNNEVVSS